ncbi:hypothetical protein Tco_0322257 [Tanacetum coccineum]
MRDLRSGWRSAVVRSGGCYKGLRGNPLDVVFDGVLGALGEEEVVMGEGVVVTSSSLEILTNNCLGGIMVSLIFLEGFGMRMALVEVMVDDLVLDGVDMVQDEDLY